LAENMRGGTEVIAKCDRCIVNSGNVV
jgi:hypothetical protein